MVLAKSADALINSERAPPNERGGDTRELPEEARVETVEKLGEAVLLIECADGGKLKLYFSL
jgi:hypothetical protein